eukprot:COSAG05_NODE_1925_length_3826_cov_17.328153_4_plen_76_part_00
MKLPRHLQPRGEFRQQLKLDPSTADLKAKDPRFFLRGVQLSKSCDEDERDELRRDLKVRTHDPKPTPETTWSLAA